MESPNWDTTRDFAQAVLGLEPGNADAMAYLDSAQSVQDNQPSTPSRVRPISAPPTDQPTSFANGRYGVKRFPGEGAFPGLKEAWDVDVSGSGSWIDVSLDGAPIK